MPELYSRKQLRDMIDCYGVSVINDKKLCKNLLSDLAPEQRLEIHLLMTALEQGMVEQLVKPSSSPIALELNRLAQNLRDSTGIEWDLAYWAIESWALALDVILEPLPRMVTPSESVDVEKPSSTVKPMLFKPIFFTVCVVSVLIFGSWAVLSKKDVKSVAIPLEKPATQHEILPLPEKSEQAEDAWTQNRIGDKYFDTSDYKAAAVWYEKAALQGDATAQSNIGYLYAQGLGVQKDDAKALYWYQKAADQGNAEGQQNLGLIYEYGYGVPKNQEQAIFWYRKAAEQGVFGAQQRLEQLIKN